MNTDHEFSTQNDEPSDQPSEAGAEVEPPADLSSDGRMDADAGETSTTETGPAGGRPFGFWLKLVDRRLSDEIEQVLAEDDLTRRDWRMLNLLAGKARDEHLAAKLEAKPGLVHKLAERGWVEGTPPTITDAGREALERLTGQVGAVRARVADAVSPEDFATTIATLEAIARELGWDESQPLPRGRRGGRGFGRRHGGFGGPFAGFGGRGHGFGRGEWPGHGFGPGPRERGGHEEHSHDQEQFDPREHVGHADRFGHGEHHGHGHGHGHGRGHGRGERCAPHDRREVEGFDPRERHGKRGRFGERGPRDPRQDVHVHVHVHDGHGRRYDV